MKTRTAAHSGVVPHTIDSLSFVLPADIGCKTQIVEVPMNINSPNVAQREESKVSRFLHGFLR